MAETGNTNVYTIFQGKYAAENGGASFDNITVMLTNTNEVCFMGNCSVDGVVNAGETLFTMPEECKPPMDFTLPVVFNDGQNVQIVAITIDADGIVTSDVALSNGTLYTGGISYNIGGKWY